VQENTTLLESKIETLAALKLLQGQFEKNEKEDRYGNVFRVSCIPIPKLDIIDVMAQDVSCDRINYVIYNLRKKCLITYDKRAYKNLPMYPGFSET